MTMEKQPTSFRIIDMEILNPSSGGLVKIAAIALPPGEVYDPDFMYSWVRAVSAGEFWGSNRNADFFPESELIKGSPSFMQAHVFKNHENKLVEKAIGNVLKNVWNDQMKYVELLIKTSRILALEICHNVEKGLATDVSMGCKVKYSVCSICGNVAKTRQDFCEHMEKHRNEIYPDGRQAFEINYNPNFHDISWVLRGADGTAKHLELLAYLGANEMEKAASGLFIPQMRREVIQVITHTPPEDEAAELFAKAAATNKEAFLGKFGEMEKVIRSKIIGLAGLEHGQRFSNQVQDVVHLIKMLYTNYWDQDRAEEIARLIKQLATKNSMPVEHVFERFTGIAELLGIELSPLEVDRILSHLCDCKERDEQESSYQQYASRIADPLMYARRGEEIEQRFAGTEDPVSSDRLAALYALTRMPAASQLFAPLRNTAIPTGFRMIVMRMPGRPLLEKSAADDDLINYLAKQMPERSHYAAHLVPRMAKIASGTSKPTENGLLHFAPLHIAGDGSDYTSKTTLGFVYGQYQAGRVKQAQSVEMAAALEKYATLTEGRKVTLNDSLREFATFSKTAAYTYPFRHRLFFGAPAIHAYSQWQRSRLNNDENLSSFQRFAVENPQLLQAVNLWMGGKIFRNIHGLGTQGFNKLREAGRTVSRLVSLAEGFDEALEKTASNPLRMFAEKVGDALGAIDTEGVDIYLSQNPETEVGLGDKSGWVKAATLYYEIGREDAVAEIQQQRQISDEHIATYLNNMRKVAGNELTKIASGMAGQMVDGILKGEWLSGFTGLVLNAYLVDKIASQNKEST